MLKNKTMLFLILLPALAPAILGPRVVLPFRTTRTSYTASLSVRPQRRRASFQVHRAHVVSPTAGRTF